MSDSYSSAVPSSSISTRTRKAASIDYHSVAASANGMYSLMHCQCLAINQRLNCSFNMHLISFPFPPFQSISFQRSHCDWNQ
jgi:hypothetical protein